MFLKQRCVSKIYHKADEKNKMSTTGNCDLGGGGTAVQLSVIYEIEGNLSFVKNYVSYKNTLVSLLHRRSSKKKKILILEKWFSSLLI